LYEEKQFLIDILNSKR